MNDLNFKKKRKYTNTNCDSDELVETLVVRNVTHFCRQDAVALLKANQHVMFIYVIVKLACMSFY